MAGVSERVGLGEQKRRQHRWRAVWGKFAVVALIVTFVAAMSICVLPPIWPGELKLTAPIFCISSELGGRYTPMVVTDSVSTGDGTAYNWTLYCVGPRGETKNAGYGLPIGVLFVAHWLILALIAAVFMLRKRTPALDLSKLRRRRREPTPKPQRYFVFDNTPGDKDAGPGSGI